MCYICNCFAWALDVVQRLVTYFLACIISSIICIGLLVAIAAGVAYGYNYSMAEFLTFTRQDVTVYMRRGQFYDKPDIDRDRDMRRSNDEDDAFGMNKSVDYQDNMQSGAKALPDTWAQVKDTRMFAEVLTKYSSQKDETNDDDDVQIIRPIGIPESTFTEKVTRTAPRVWTAPEKEWNAPEKVEDKIVSVAPGVPTMVVDSGASQIIMRKFQPLEEITHIVTTSRMPPNDFFYENPRDKVRPTDSETRKNTEPPDIKIIVEDASRSNPYVPLRSWATTEKKSLRDYPDDVDEDNIMYKPV